MFAVTGASGFLGRHLRTHLFVKRLPYSTISQTELMETNKLVEHLNASRTLIHLAGANFDDERAESNVTMAESIADALVQSNSCHVVFAGSIREESDGLYGRSKIRATEILAKVASDRGHHLSVIRMPHLFGEFGIPFYNSAAATFAHCLAEGKTPQVMREGEVELLHVGTAAAEILRVARHENRRGVVRLKGRKMSVGDLWDQMCALFERYSSEHYIPNVENSFDLELLNMLRDHMFRAGLVVRKLAQHQDERGSFTELLRTDGPGQFSVSSSKPGVVRGNHFHLRKIERFVILEGKATLKIRPLFSAPSIEIDLSGDNLEFVDIPTLHTHSLENSSGTTMLAGFWCQDHFTDTNPDTYSLPVSGVDEGVI